MKLAKLAARLDCKLEGDPELEINGVAGLADGRPGDLTFLSNPRYRSAVSATRATAIVVSDDAGPMPLAALRSPHPYYAFARAIEIFHPAPRFEPGVHPTATVSSSADIGPGAHIGPYCFVGDNVRIGRNAVLHSFVAVYRDAVIGDDFFAHSHAVVREACRIGNRVLLQNGVVVGSDGFGFARTPEGHWHKMRQAGIALVEDDVEIQANSCVDRATIGLTRIGRGAKLDNLVQIGHSSSVGEDTLLCGQVGLAGTSRVGNRVILAGQVGVAGHLTIGDGAVLTAQSGVPNDVPPGAFYSGYPAMDNKGWLKSVAVFHRLPDVQRQVRELRQQVDSLQGSATKAKPRPPRRRDLGKRKKKRGSKKK